MDFMSLFSVTVAVRVTPNGTSTISCIVVKCVM